MKTVKLFTTLVLILVVTNGFSQYLETFSIQDRGVLPGTCMGTEASCTTDYTGVDWVINGDFSGMDDGTPFGSPDFFATLAAAAGRLQAGGDCDASPPGICFETPIIDISAVAGAASFTVELDWESWDFFDVADVEYQLDGGSWVQLPPLGGTDGPGTVDFTTDGNTGSGTASASGLSGNTLSIRVCTVSDNASDDLYIDNVSVPEVGAVVLPVKWADFKVRSLKTGNQLDWATFTEVNNERFEIEKSINNLLDFKKIGSVEGSGNSTITSRYEFLDLDQSGDVVYYRIKQVDFDGEFEYSQIVSIRNDRFGKLGFTPNPFSDQLLISTNQLSLEEGKTLTMFNSQGQKVLEKTITEYNVNDPINTEYLQAGMYFIHFGNGEVVRVVKF